MNNESSVFRDPLLTKRLQEKYGDEQVFAVTSSEVTDIEDKFSPTSSSAAKLVTRLQYNGRYILRAMAEQNASMQQIIPYVVIINSTLKETPFFVYQRISGEERLKDSWSLGVGGHINTEDGINNAVKNCLYRELNEEIFYEPVKEPVFLGTMRNMESALNDHFGLIYKQYVSSASVREKDNMAGFWCSFQDLVDNYDKFEAWGKYLIDYWYLLPDKKKILN